MLEEESKAVQEVARTTGKALDIVKASGKALEGVLGEVFRQLGSIASDWVRYLRFRNTLLIADKTSTILRERNIKLPLKAISPSLALPLIEAASLETEDDIQALWAALIANSADPGKDIAPRKVYIEILRGLEPLDAKILEFLGKPEIDNIYTIMVEETLNAAVLSKELAVDAEQVKISLQNLARHGCVLDAWENTWKNLDHGYSGFRVNNPKSNFRLSHLGKALFSATRVA